MIREISIENFKSVASLKLELGRINVLIGANGSGKSNILEAIAFASAAASNKLDNEFLASRGIRVTEPRFMRSAFDEEPPNELITFHIRNQRERPKKYCLKIDPKRSYGHWQYVGAPGMPDEAIERLLQNAKEGLAKLPIKEPFRPEQLLTQLQLDLFRLIGSAAQKNNYIIYSPENSALRVFQAEGQILPFGIKGEGLFAHLKALSTPENETKLSEIIERLALLDWFEGFEIPKDLVVGERTLRIRDRYLAEGALFDQCSANEGFLFLLFYFALFISPDTPAFFAIDNIDASLNPKLCAALMKALVELAKKHNKQAILTTHNPALLDGLDLSDNEQRLFVIERNTDGHTKAHRISAPKPLDGDAPVALSEAFLRGYIGGLPKNF